MMEILLKTAALGLGTAASVAAYLSLPQQGWLKRPLPALATRLAALACLLVGYLLLAVGGLSTAPALFALLVIAMLMLSLLPFSVLVTGSNAAGAPRIDRGDGLATGTPVKRSPIRPHWWAKSLLGAVLGFTLALALSGLWAWWGPGGIDATDKVQFNMWIITPIWMTVFSLVYLFRSGWQALLGLGALNLLAWVLVWLASGAGHA